MSLKIDSADVHYEPDDVTKPYSSARLPARLLNIPPLEAVEYVVQLVPTEVAGCSVVSSDGLPYLECA